MTDSQRVKSKVSAFELHNRAQMHFFEFAPLLLRELKFEQRQFRDNALRNVTLELSEKLGNCMGICFPEERVIRLNQRYFTRHLTFLPYTLFHEMVHQYLFDIQRPWHHNKEFYFLMELFPSWYPVDPNIHIHMRSANAGKREMQTRKDESTFEDKLNELMRTRFGKTI